MKKIKDIFLHLFIALAILFLLIIITALIFAYTNINDRYLQTFVTGSITISCLISSFLLNRRIKEKGILYGGIFGILFCLILYIISLICGSNFIFSNTLLVYLGVCSLSGIVGGIVGVNV